MTNKKDDYRWNDEAVESKSFETERDADEYLKLMNERIKQAMKK